MVAKYPDGAKERATPFRSVLPIDVAQKKKLATHC